MESVLRATFEEFNKKTEGEYYIDRQHNLIGYAENGGCASVCPIEEITNISFSLDRALIHIEANESLILTTSGPEF